MRRDARAMLEDLARHRRDEEAVAMRRLATHLEELTGQALDLRGKIERAELGARQVVADAFERDLADNYLRGLRAALARVDQEREEKLRELSESQEALEQRVIQHRQMSRLHRAAEADRRVEAGRREDAQLDDLATGSWHRKNGEERR
ncbi:MAG: hypothetical protein QGH45_00920 [Myxococcota bacterium]|jgi:hypothetical protein|nr:hypothetical protein [Myxococcota bacterium]